ncbi:MAG: ribonuclease P protein component [Rhizobiaceae bacterium]
MRGKNCDTENSDCNVARLPRRKDFLRLRSGKRHSTASFTLQSKPVELTEKNNACRVGYTVTTKVGSSVVRNRIRRRLRAAVTSAFPGHCKAGYDYALIARRKALTCDFATIVQELHHALDHIHRNRAKGPSGEA